MASMTSLKTMSEYIDIIIIILHVIFIDRFTNSILINVSQSRAQRTSFVRVCMRVTWDQRWRLAWLRGEASLALG